MTKIDFLRQAIGNLENKLDDARKKVLGLEAKQEVNKCPVSNDGWGDAIEFIEEKGLLDEFQNWLSGPMPKGVIDYE